MSLIMLLTIVGVLLALVVVVGLALVLRDPGAAQRRIESVFRRPP